MGCPEPLMAQAVVDYAIVFCEDSLALREKLDTFTTVAGTSAYALDAPTSLQVARILNVWVGGTAIPSLAADTAVPPNFDRATPRLYYTTRTDSELELQLYPTPDASYTITVEVALRPTRGATSLPDDLFDLWVEPVCHGAVGQLMQIPGQAFTNPVSGMGFAARATQLSRKARIDGGIGQVRASRAINRAPFA
jgi:hypothetical protein